ncbi:MAG: undecaprenyl-phosphate glucose phosphotransferase [Burkholderiales bacterium]|jgi:putative colanic acid biosynthesis UDP-glucose lipid carrier transferase|nr:undecaprenyl-phosphate glucose phosphotransferase [Burkholderiales bacterium]
MNQPLTDAAELPYGAAVQPPARGPFSRSLGDRSMFSGDLPHVALLRSLLNPTVILASLGFCLAVLGVPLDGHYLMLAVLAFFVSSQLFDRVDLFRLRPAELVVRAARDVLFAWPLTVAVIGFLIWATHYNEIYDRMVLTAWFLFTPIPLVFAHLLAHYALRAMSRTAEAQKRVVLIGASRLSLRLVETLQSDPLLGVEVLGFFDDRVAQRLPDLAPHSLKGPISQVPQFVRDNNVNLVFISLPMVAQPRILSLLDELRDTTASVYFIPDIFAFDLIQSRFDEIDGMPVVAVCETPYSGVNGLLKRWFDILATLAGLCVIWPLMLFAAIGVKLSSPGPIIFKQRRYGADGREILVYKFRSMTTTDNGPVVKQATKGDKRITPFGAFIRRTSIDELPQLFNVLFGSMSLVGPRPHAVAHNEQYRSLIKGYMLRHKVRPGITGWAQVNGYRGETETVDKMKGRVEHDLYYLRHWSLSLDLWIIVKTVLLIFRDKQAY